MINLFNLESDKLRSLFSQEDFTNFFNTVVKFLCLRKSFLPIIQEIHGLHQDDDIAEHMIPTAFNKEEELLNDNNI
jgi:hypothetical protein